MHYKIYNKYQDQYLPHQDFCYFVSREEVKQLAIDLAIKIKDKDPSYAGVVLDVQIYDEHNKYIDVIYIDAFRVVCFKCEHSHIVVEINGERSKLICKHCHSDEVTTIYRAISNELLTQIINSEERSELEKRLATFILNT